MAVFSTIILALFLLLPAGEASAQPGLYTVTGDRVNIRSGPGTGYSVVGSRGKGDTVTVLSFYDAQWARVRLGDSPDGYMSSRYLAYKGPLPEENQQSAQSTRSRSSGGVWDTLWKITRTLLWISVLVVLIGAKIENGWAAPAFLLQFICGLGAVVGWLAFGNAKAGAVVGMGVGIVLGIRELAKGLDWDLGGIGLLGYVIWYLVSYPFYVLNLLQFWLSKPWRPLLKRNVFNDYRMRAWRRFFAILQVPFYILCFPLRIVNAVYYNIIIHNVYELSNYVIEVVVPSDWDEGGDGFWKWIVWFPVRIGKYLIWHGLMTFVESIAWTVIDTFVPAVTLYHGTAGESADSMLCDPERNHHRKATSGWLSGIWNVGGGNYAGDGIYFGIFRKTLRNYASGSAIVARVTMGRTVDVALIPDVIYNQAGKPNASAVSNWALNRGYVSGEWWRCDRHTNWWEICLYDRQNRYNDSWRIRPIYAINSSTGVMQRIPGGTAHWLFRRMVLRDLRNSIDDFWGR